MARIVYVIAVSLFLTACTVTVKQLEPGSTLVVDSETHGLLLSSSSFSGKFPEGARLPWSAKPEFRCESYQMVYRYLEESDERIAGQLSAIPDGENTWTLEDPHDFLVDDGLGFVAATHLPAGRYEVYFFTSICLGTSFYAMEDFSIPFEIKPGVATYVGEIGYTHGFYDNFLGVSEPTPPVISFGMESERDLPLLQSKYPFISDFTLEEVELPWHLRF